MTKSMRLNCGILWIMQQVDVRFWQRQDMKRSIFIEGLIVALEKLITKDLELTGSVKYQTQMAMSATVRLMWHQLQEAGTYTYRLVCVLRQV